MSPRALGHEVVNHVVRALRGTPASDYRGSFGAAQGVGMIDPALSSGERLVARCT